MLCHVLCFFPVWPNPAFGEITSNSIKLHLPRSSTPITYFIYRQQPGTGHYTLLKFLGLVPLGPISWDPELEIAAQPGVPYNFAFQARQGTHISSRSSTISVITPGNFLLKLEDDFRLLNRNRLKSHDSVMSKYTFSPIVLFLV